jgi:hypothetical protein
MTRTQRRNKTKRIKFLKRQERLSIYEFIWAHRDDPLWDFLRLLRQRTLSGILRSRTVWPLVFTPDRMQELKAEWVKEAV